VLPELLEGDDPLAGLGNAQGVGVRLGQEGVGRPRLASVEAILRTHDNGSACSRESDASEPRACGRRRRDEAARRAAPRAGCTSQRTCEHGQLNAGKITGTTVGYLRALPTPPEEYGRARP
jgi:hypothetical protein